MATIHDFKEWLKPLLKYGRPLKVIKEDVNWVPGPECDCKEYDVELYTASNLYRISATERLNGRGYLGCTVSARYPRLGEYWLRGNDLPDGDLAQETWQHILHSVIAYELTEPYGGKNPDLSGTFCTLAKSLLGAYRQLGFVKEGFVEFASELQVLDAFGEKVVDKLVDILAELPISYLPELLTGEDKLVRKAAAKVIDSRGEDNESILSQ